MTPRLLISGACGRMGRLLWQGAAEAGFQVVAGLDRQADPGLPFPLFDRPGACTAPVDLIIDFSSPAALPGLLSFAVGRKLPLLLGATGYAEQDLAQIRDAAQAIPLFQSSNMSLGVYVLRLLAQESARLLPGYDIEIIERHHNRKLDAPSGTALSLYAAVKGPATQEQHGREGKNARRMPQEVGLHAIRGGTVAGEHEVGFYGPQESLRLQHIAENRAVFAAGALRIAGWLLKQGPGLYGMEEYMQSIR